MWWDKVKSDTNNYLLHARCHGKRMNCCFFLQLAVLNLLLFIVGLIHRGGGAVWCSCRSYHCQNEDERSRQSSGWKGSAFLLRGILCVGQSALNEKLSWVLSRKSLSSALLHHLSFWVRLVLTQWVTWVITIPNCWCRRLSWFSQTSTPATIPTRQSSR